MTGLIAKQTLLLGLTLLLLGSCHLVFPYRAAKRNSQPTDILPDASTHDITSPDAPLPDTLTPDKILADGPAQDDVTSPDAPPPDTLTPDKILHDKRNKAAFEGCVQVCTALQTTQAKAASRSNAKKAQGSAARRRTCGKPYTYG
jgi:hypothetical protein